MTEQEIFFEAIDITDATARVTFVERACGEDLTLRRKVMELLQEHFSEETLLATGVVEGLRPTQVEFTAELEGPGSQIGRYKLLQRLGEGGFGIVYMAEQKEPVKRRVALKIIKLGMDTRQVVARFEAERQALALMDHPNIAKVLDAGATETGRPYFVMELVRGVPITKYCDDNSLNTRERLLLFIAVCNAIQHAHQKGIIHRDIKPSNVLVTLHDGVPVPKVIDFGIAKATQQELTDKTLFTQFQQFIGTPAYMSPEQAEMSGLDIDTRSDVYSLGVLLYELLVGRTPLDSRALLSSGYEEIRRRIKEEEPPKPSTRISTLHGEERTCLAKLRGIAPEQLQSELRGDLDWIVLKALEKDRQRRYETASGFANDIRRFLDNDPVLAAPPSRSYRLRKYMRRHRAALFVAALVVLVLMLATALSGWQAWRATEARRAETAQRELAEARQRKAESEEKRADRETEAARQAELEARRTSYAIQMLLASTSWDRNNQRHLRKLLLATADNPERGPEWYFWQRICRLELHSLKFQPQPVESLKFSPDDIHLASGDAAGGIAIWNANSGERIHSLKGHAARISILTFSSDGKLLASGDERGQLKLWDVAKGVPLSEYSMGTNKLTSVVFSSDGMRIAACSLFGATWIWDRTTGTRQSFPADPEVHEPQYEAVRLTTISPDFNTLVTGYRHGHFTIRDREDFTDKSEFNAPDDEGYIFSPDAKFVQDGSRVVLTALGGRIDIIDIKSRDLIRRFRSPEISSMDITPDGSLIVIGTYFGRTVELWNTKTTNLVASFRGHSFRPSSVAVSPTGRIFASGDQSGEIKVWTSDPRRECVRVKGGNTSLRIATFSKDGQRVVTADWRNQTRIWDATTGKQLHNFQTAAPCAFFPDNRRLLTTSGGWKFGSNGPLQILDLETGNQLGIIQSTNCVDMDISPDGKRILLAKESGAVEVWSSESLELQRSIPFDSTNTVFCRFSPIGNTALTGGGDKLFLWNTSTGELIKTIPVPEDQLSFVCATFSPDGKWVVTGHMNGSLGLWDATNGAHVRNLEYHSGQVTSVNFSPDGRRILSSSSDGTAKLWDPLTGKEVFSILDPGKSIVRAAFSPDGRRLLHACANEIGMVTIWTLGTPEEAELWLKAERNLDALRSRNNRQE